jgi:hypothetical protein
MEQLEQIEQVEQAVLRIALEELAGAENMGYTGLPWNAVYKAFKELGMEPKPAVMEPFYWKVIAEGKRWQKEALQKLWGTLGISVPPWVYDRLESKNWEVVWTVYFQKKTPQIQVGFPSLDPLVFRLPKPHPSGGFSVSAWPGGMEVGVKALHARKKRAYLMADALTDIGITLTAVRSFAPVFAFLGLADLERALLVLEGLKDGEVRREGAYLLARERGTRVLFRGTLTGDLDLDGALLLGREVTLGTEEIKVRMKVRVEAGQTGPRMRIEEGFIEWGEEVSPFAPPYGPEVGLQERDAINRLIRDSLQHFLSATSRLIPPPSPPMRGLIEELVDSNPLEALKAEDLPSRAYMRLLSHY